MAEIDLMLDEENELTFQLNIEGTRPAEASCRLVLESDNMSLVFDAERGHGDEVNVVLPPLTHVLKEGTYNMALEVIVDDKYFRPLTLAGNFEKSVVVMAEAVVRKKRKKPTATASLVSKGKGKKKLRNTPMKENLRNRPEKRKIEEVSDQDIMNIIKALSKK